jgi:hypothetical protein
MENYFINIATGTRVKLLQFILKFHLLVIDKFQTVISFCSTCVVSFGSKWETPDVDGLAGPVAASGFKPGKQSGICITK